MEKTVKYPWKQHKMTKKKPKKKKDGWKVRNKIIYAQSVTYTLCYQYFSYCMNKRNLINTFNWILLIYLKCFFNFLYVGCDFVWFLDAFVVWFSYFSIQATQSAENLLKNIIRFHSRRTVHTRMNWFEQTERVTTQPFASQNRLCAHTHAYYVWCRAGLRRLLAKHHQH